MGKITVNDTLEMSVEERIRFVVEVWDTIGDPPQALPLSAAQRALLERRIAEHRSDPEAASDWKEARSRILSFIP